MSEIRGVRYCVYCCNHAPQKVVYESEGPGDFDAVDDKLIPIYYDRNFIVTCGTCSKLSLYVDECIDHEDTEDDSSSPNPPCEKKDPVAISRRSFWRAKLFWPNKPKPNLNLDFTAIPNDVIEIYREASGIKSLGPTAFVVQIRRALEAICLDQGVKERTLNASLQKLIDEGRLPALLGEITNVIKVIGNAGAHAGCPPVLHSHVLAIDDFFRIVLDYLYIAPSKLKKFKAEAEKFNL